MHCHIPDTPVPVTGLHSDDVIATSTAHIRQRKGGHVAPFDVSSAAAIGT